MLFHSCIYFEKALDLLAYREKQDTMIWGTSTYFRYLSVLLRTVITVACVTIYCRSISLLKFTCTGSMFLFMSQSTTHTACGHSYYT